MLKSNRFQLYFAIIYTIILLYFSLGNPDEVLPDEYVFYQDKILHLVAYIGLAIIWSFYFFRKNNSKGILTSFISTLVFGIVLEFMQEIFNPLRQFDYFDMLANCIGVVIGTIIVIFYKNLKLK